MTDDTARVEEPAAVKLFGEGRSALVERGPDRRAPEALPPREPLPIVLKSEPLRPMDPAHAVRLGRGDGIATALLVLGLLAFAATVIVGSLILYNAKTVGAFSDPWDSTRVAIGCAVLALGIVQSALLIGLSRAISYLLAGLRLRTGDTSPALHRDGE